MQILIAKNKNYQKFRGHSYYTGKDRGAAHSICNLKFNVPNEIPLFVYNSSNYDYHFIIKELANEFEVVEIGVTWDNFKLKPEKIKNLKDFLLMKNSYI